MMRESIKTAAQSPYFQLTMSVGINNLLSAAKLLSSIGVDVNPFIQQALQSINEQLADVAYDMTDLDELLRRAQAIGDEVVQKSQTEAGNATSASNEEDGNQS